MPARKTLLPLLMLALLPLATCAPTPSGPDYLEVGTSYYFFFGAGRLPRATVTPLEIRPDGWVRGIQSGRIAWVNANAAMMITVAPEAEQIDIENWEPTDEYETDFDPRPNRDFDGRQPPGQRRK